jgi:hypothetical protein
MSGVFHGFEGLGSATLHGGQTARLHLAYQIRHENEKGPFPGLEKFIGQFDSLVSQALDRVEAGGTKSRKDAEHQSDAA